MPLTGQPDGLKTALAEPPAHDVAVVEESLLRAVAVGEAHRLERFEDFSSDDRKRGIGLLYVAAPRKPVHRFVLETAFKCASNQTHSRRILPSLSLLTTATEELKQLCRSSFQISRL